MIGSFEFNKFVNSVAKFHYEIMEHSVRSWNGVDFNLDEPNIIKKYLLGSGVGVDYLNRNLAPVLSHGNYQVKFASIFVHQKPRITRLQNSINLCLGDTPSCELGDLLVVFCLLDRDKTPLFKSAVISQAKKDEYLTSQSQKCFYDSDMSFGMPARVYNNSIINTPERILPDYSQGRTKALQYLILDRNWPFLRQIPWNSTVAYRWDLFLTRILTGDLGLSFEDVDKNNPDWNCILHDLLNIGHGVIPSRIKRGSNLEELVGIFNDFGEYENYSLEIEDQQGLPTLFIIVRDTEFKLDDKL